MTVSSENSAVTVTANGTQTTFSYNFIVPSAGDALLYLTPPGGEAVLLSPAVWSLTGAGNATGGTFIYPLAGSPVPAGHKLTLVRNVAATQTANLNNQSGFFPRVIEAALDRTVLVLQQCLTTLARVLRSSPTEPPLAELPLRAFRANNLLGFNSNGDPIATPGASISGVVVSAYAADLLNAPSAGAARSVLGASATGDAVFTASTASAARSALEASATGDAVFTASTASAARSALGASATGDAVFTASTASAARSTLGASATGDAVFTASTASAARSALGASATGDAVFTASTASAARTAIGAAATDIVAAKTVVRSGEWVGSTSLPTTDTTFFDILLPPNTAQVIGSGFVLTSPSTGDSTYGLFDVALLNDSLVEQSRHRASTVEARDSHVGSGGVQVGFHAIPQGNANWRLRFFGRRSNALVTVALVEYRARIMAVAW